MAKTSAVSKEPAPSSSPVYKEDFYSWAFHQARLVREGRLTEIDRVHIAEELEDLGRTERRSLRSALARVIQHLLKWDFQPAKRTASWQNSINVHRVHASQDLRENPGLKFQLDEIVGEAYEVATAYAVEDTGLSRSTFPASCPYTFDVIMTRELGSEQE